MDNNINILFTCAGRRNYLINYFKEAIGDDGKIFAADMQLSAPALVDAHKSFLVPSIYDNNYIPTLLEICLINKINAIISLNDLELPILSSNRKKFEEAGVNILISSENVIDITFDKYKTAEFSKKIGIKTPDTYKTLLSAENAIDENKLDFPIIIKPRWGSASIGIEIVYDKDELKLAYQLQKIKLERSILANASRNDIDKAILIQQFIDGQEFGLDIINDLNGNYRTTVVKQKLAMRAGETDKAKTVNNPKLEMYGEKIAKELKHVGNLDCDFFFSNGKYYLLEMNSRFGGGYPFSQEAGINLPLAIIKWLKGEEVQNNILKTRYNEAFSKCDKLIKIHTEQ